MNLDDIWKLPELMGGFFYIAGIILMILVYIEFKILAIYLPKWWYEWQMEKHNKKKREEEDIAKKLKEL